MDPDPMQFVEEDNNGNQTDAPKSPEKPKAHLNTWVAISVALLATFMGICKVKDDNIVQAMQQAQADKIDDYSWYQARNIREEVAEATVAQLTAQAAAAAPQANTHQKTSACPVIRRTTSAGNCIDAQIVSLTNAWLPRPSAKNAYRQLSCSKSAGSVSPSAMKASRAVPSSNKAATNAPMPEISPATAAVPAHFATARCQVGKSVSLNLTCKGPVTSPRDALSRNP